MALGLYLGTAAVLLLLAHRLVTPVSRAAALVLIVLPMLFTGYALVTGGVYGPIDHPYQSQPLEALKSMYGIGPQHNIALTDVYAQMFPWKRVVQLSYARGEWPLWNPYMLCGHLLAAAAQPAAYSPFTILGCLLPVAQSFTFGAAIAFFLAALTAFLLARELRCTEGAALIGAAAWTCSTSIIMYIQTPLGTSWAMAPLVLLAAKRIVREPGIRSGALLAFALTLILLLGHPESVLLVVLVGSGWALFDIVHTRAHPLRPIVTAFAAGAIALLLCAIQLLPLQEAVLQSGEYEYKSKYWANTDRAAPPMQVVANLATDLVPYLYLRKWSDPELPLPKAESFAVGSIALALAVYAVARRRTAETTFLAIAIVLSIAVTIAWGPAVNALQHVPLLKITHNERLAFAAALLLSMLAAMGVDELMTRRDARAAAAVFLTTLALLGLATWWLTQHVTLAELPNDWGTYKIPAELLGLALAIAVVLARRATVPLLLALLIAQRVVSDAGAQKTFPARAAYPRIALFDALRDVREPFRIVGLRYALIPATSVFYGLEDARGYEAITFWPTAKTFPLWCQHQPIWFNRVDDLTRPFLSFLNVRYAVAAADEAIPPGWHRVAAQPGSMLLENEHAIERIFVPRSVRIGLADEAAVAEMLHETDFRERAWISADVAAPERINGPGRVVLSKRRLGGEYLLDADMSGDGWIVVSDTAWRGWRAYIDGRRVETTRANVAFLSVFVPKGRHAVRLVYLPQSFVVGRAISGATLLGVFVFALARRRATAAPARSA
ncbi:MAG TPA: YfhO family protein [Thermoanaerobaculia bacterium]|jgi:hypothetical protein